MQNACWVTSFHELKWKMINLNKVTSFYFRALIGYVELQILLKDLEFQDKPSFSKKIKGF